MMILSGYAIGFILFSWHRKSTGSIIRNLIHGNVILNFAFISGFIFFGLLTFAATEYFTAFTYITAGLSIFGVYLLLRKLIVIVTQNPTDIRNGDNLSDAKSDAKSSNYSNNWKISILFGITLISSVLVYHGIVIYYHPIFSEYDSLYVFLPISKSILLGNGLNHDYYLGSDVNMRYPPFIQTMNAWLIQSFGYSSIRLFPVYYIFLATMLVYLFVRNTIIKISNIKESSFLSLIASSVFLITPSVLVVSSRFSLQQDLGFIFLLTASFYFLSDIIRSQKPMGTSLLMLSFSLALLTLTREVGLVISTSLFFLVPAIKFTENNLVLRGIFTTLSFLPLYLYYFVFYGSVEIASGLLLVMSNMAVFFIVFQLKNQNKFSSLLRPVCIAYMSPFVIPTIFVLSNIVMFNGVYPGIVYSDKYYETADIQFEIFALPHNSPLEISNLIKAIPRLDILFTSVAMGSVMIFFKLAGFGKLIYYVKNNYEYSLVLILVIFLLVTWAFLLQSGFEISNIRHVLYFAPILAVIVAAGMHIGHEASNIWRLYYYGLIVFMSYYFLVHNLTLLNSNNFTGLFIDPIRNPIITKVDLTIAAILISPLIILTIRRLLSSRSRDVVVRTIPKALSVICFSVLLMTQVYILGSSAITLMPLKEKEHNAPPGWENNVFEVINYLGDAEAGNVLSARAPAVAFFTNRTNFDLFNVQAFGYVISDLLSSNTSENFKSGLSERDIKYIVLPNERSNLQYITQNIIQKYPILVTLDSDSDFKKIDLGHFNAYKYNPSIAGSISLIDKTHTWKGFGQTTVVQNINDLIIAAGTDRIGKIYNRAYLPTEIKLMDKPLLLSFDYKVETKIGNASYSVEVRDVNYNKVVFNSLLNSDPGSSSSQTFLLPSHLVNKPVEFRVYIVTDGPGHHSLSIKNARIMYR